VSALPITVEVVCATRERQVVRNISLPAGATVAQAIAAAGIGSGDDDSSDCFRDLGNVVGVWGRLAGLESVLRDGDRVECLRPLTTDPKEARRRREEVRRRRG
jgi:uncharacterized protein